MRYALIASITMMMACKSGDVAQCELDVNGVTVCIEEAMTYGFCANEAGGTPTVASSSEDPTCPELGYETECLGSVIQEGDGVTAELVYYAASQEDCDATEGGSFSTK
jgi:hypothetical protein